MSIFKISIRVAFLNVKSNFKCFFKKPHVRFFPNPFTAWQLKRFLKVTRHLEFSMLWGFIIINLDLILGGRWDD